MKTGTADLPLHYGKAPSWLFQRMKRLAREIVIFMVSEFGPEEVLNRLSDPFWFQSLGCVLGFDWHSSGLTTTVCGSIKEGIKGLENDLGFFVAGGKGKVSRQTPTEIEGFGDLIDSDPQKLVYASKVVAKVDSAALQDGFQLYHHCFFFTKGGSWCVVQQGMNETNRYARRYHWLGTKVEDFVNEPHYAVCCDLKGTAWNMVAAESEPAREISAKIAGQKPETLLCEIDKLQQLSLPAYHQVTAREINRDYLSRILLKTYEDQPRDFENLLMIKGVGPKTIRALSLISELVYGAAVSFKDPARYSFAHGGKDGYPYPVDRQNYDRSIEILEKAVNQAHIQRSDRIAAFKRLERFSLS
jgi:hypothetical protein